MGGGEAPAQDAHVREAVLGEEQAEVLERRALLRRRVATAAAAAATAAAAAASCRHCRRRTDPRR